MEFPVLQCEREIAIGQYELQVTSFRFPEVLVIVKFINSEIRWTLDISSLASNSI